VIETTSVSSSATDEQSPPAHSAPQQVTDPSFLSAANDYVLAEIETISVISAALKVEFSDEFPP